MFLYLLAAPPEVFFVGPVPLAQLASSALLLSFKEIPFFPSLTSTFCPPKPCRVPLLLDQPSRGFAHPTGLGSLSHLPARTTSPMPWHSSPLAQGQKAAMHISYILYAWKSIILLLLYLHELEKLWQIH